MRALALAVSVTVLTTGCGSPTAPTTLTTAPAVPAASATISDHGDHDDDDPDDGAVHVRIISQERTGPCVIHVRRIPAADPIPIEHDGEDYVDLEWCSRSPTGTVNATVELSSGDHPKIDFYAALENWKNGCRTTRTYWTILFPYYDQMHVSVTAGLLHDRATCGVRY
jgi:hypothetical protein